MLSGETVEWWQEFFVYFYQAFLENDRWMRYLEGVGSTLLVTTLALAIGLVLGIIVAIIRTAYAQQRPGSKNPLLGVFDKICGVYVTVIRGTPMMVQLLIMYFVIFSSSRNDTMVGALTLGINSGAYVAEIIRGGIESVDKGQFEAGRSLGFGYVRTMALIIIPQAFKAVLPALANEFIVLIKETSVSGYVGLQELTKGGDIIRSRTYSAFMPLIAVAIIYLLIVIFFSWIVSLIERRLKSSER